MRFFNFLLLLLVTLIYACGNSTASDNPSQNSSSSLSSDYKRIAQTPDPNPERESLEITMKIEGMPSGTYYLMGIVAEQYFLVDSLSQKNGSVTFTKDDPVPAGTYFGLYPDRSTAVQMLIDIDQKFTLTTVNGDIIGSMKVDGSEENKLFYDAMKYEIGIQPEFNRIAKSFESLQIGTAEHNALIAENKKLTDEKFAYLESLYKKAPKSLFTAFKEAGQNPNIVYDFDDNGGLSQAYLAEVKKNYWTNTNFEDERLLRTPVISNKLKKYYGTIMPQHPDTLRKYTDILVQQCPPRSEYYKYFVNWVTLEYEPTKTSLMDAEAVFVHMIQNYFTKEKAFWQDSVQTYGLQLRAYEMAQSLIGQTGPDVSAKGVDGKTYSIADIKTDYVIVYMWNPDCEHCAEQTPKLVNMYNQLKSESVEVFSVAVNTEDDKWRDAVKSYGMPWINVFDPTNKAIYAKYYVDNTPELYILNKDRTIIGKNLKVNQIATILDRDREKR